MLSENAKVQNTHARRRVRKLQQLVGVFFSKVRGGKCVKGVFFSITPDLYLKFETIGKTTVGQGVHTFTPLNVGEKYRELCNKKGRLRNGSASGFGPDGRGSIPCRPANLER